ncbi:MAG: HAD family hydrolase [Pseudomonadales bacterium]|nr:HAD family hydrolase [Pseudomonadales bacterium]
MVSALLFDLDQTLLYSEDFPASITRTCKALASKGAGLDPEAVAHANARIWEEFGTLQMDDWMLGKVSGKDLNVELWRRTLAACGCYDESLVEFASNTHIPLTWEEYRLFDDVHAVVEVAKANDIPMALVTNGAADTQREKLRAVGIESWFHAFSISGEHGLAKPEPLVFHRVLASLGVEGKSAWHVGDSLPQDVGGAMAAGITSVWLNRHGHRPGEDDPIPDLEIASLHELIPLIDEVG